jgi:cytochrome b561
LNVGLLLLIAGHAGAALWHHLVQKDDTLRRMLHAR